MEIEPPTRDSERDWLCRCVLIEVVSLPDGGTQRVLNTCHGMTGSPDIPFCTCCDTRHPDIGENVTVTWRPPGTKKEEVPGWQTPTP